MNWIPNQFPVNPTLLAYHRALTIKILQETLENENGNP